MLRTSPRKQLASASSGITEVVLPHAQDSLNLVLPTLAHLSRQTGSRWLTWISPQGVSREMLSEYGFDLSKVRLIHIRNQEELMWVLWDALVAGNSQTIVASPGKLSDKDLRSLETAAARGNCQGVLIRYR